MRKTQFKVTEAFKYSTKEKFALAMSINSVWCSFSYYRLLFVELSRLGYLCKETVSLYISNRLSYTQHYEIKKVFGRLHNTALKIFLFTRLHS